MKDSTFTFSLKVAKNIFKKNTANNNVDKNKGDDSDDNDDWTPSLFLAWRVLALHPPFPWHMSPYLGTMRWWSRWNLNLCFLLFSCLHCKAIRNYLWRSRWHQSFYEEISSCPFSRCSNMLLLWWITKESMYCQAKSDPARQGSDVYCVCTL